MKQRSQYRPVLFARDQKSETVELPFDLLRLDGQDVPDQPLVERKRLLKALIPPQPCAIVYVDYVEECGAALRDFPRPANNAGMRRETVNDVTALPENRRIRGKGLPYRRSAAAKLSLSSGWKFFNPASCVPIPWGSAVFIAA